MAVATAAAAPREAAVVLGAHMPVPLLTVSLGVDAAVSGRCLAARRSRSRNRAAPLLATVVVVEDPRLRCLTTQQSPDDLLPWWRRLAALPRLCRYTAVL